MENNEGIILRHLKYEDPKSIIRNLRGLAELQNREVVVGADEEFLCILPMIKKSPILVAHADTVWDTADTKDHVIYDEDIRIFRSTDVIPFIKNGKRELYGLGIGADDRAGTAMIETLMLTSNRDFGVVITTDEEMGAYSALGAKKVLDKIELNPRFFLEIDAHGYKECRTYGISTKEFDKKVKDLTGFKIVKGAFTDIMYLAYDMPESPALNISAGYRNQHTPKEVLLLDWWEESLEAVRKLLR